MNNALHKRFSWLSFVGTMAVVIFIFSSPSTLNALDCDIKKPCGALTLERCVCKDSYSAIWTFSCDSQKWPIDRSFIQVTEVTETKDGKCKLKSVEVNVTYTMPKACLSEATPYTPDDGFTKVKLLKLAQDKEFPKKDGADDLGEAPTPNIGEATVFKTITTKYSQDGDTEFDPQKPSKFKAEIPDPIELDPNYKWAIDVETYQGSTLTGRNRKTLKCDCTAPTDYAGIVGLAVSTGTSKNCCGENPDREVATAQKKFKGKDECEYKFCATVKGRVEAQDSGYDAVFINNNLIFAGENLDRGCDMAVKTCTKEVTIYGTTVTLTYDTYDGNYHVKPSASITKFVYMNEGDTCDETCSQTIEDNSDECEPPRCEKTCESPWYLDKKACECVCGLSDYDCTYGVDSETCSCLPCPDGHPDCTDPCQPLGSPPCPGSYPVPGSDGCMHWQNPEPPYPGCPQGTYWDGCACVPDDGDPHDCKECYYWDDHDKRCNHVKCEGKYCRCTVEHGCGDPPPCPNDNYVRDADCKCNCANGASKDECEASGGKWDSENCECKDCKEPDGGCPDGKTWHGQPACECRCDNPPCPPCENGKTKDDCQENEHWNPDACECECGSEQQLRDCQKSCGSWDGAECKCDPPVKDCSECEEWREWPSCHCGPRDESDCRECEHWDGCKCQPDDELHCGECERANKDCTGCESTQEDCKFCQEPNGTCGCQSAQPPCNGECEEEDSANCSCRSTQTPCGDCEIPDGFCGCMPDPACEPPHSPTESPGAGAGAALAASVSATNFGILNGFSPLGAVMALAPTQDTISLTEGAALPEPITLRINFNQVLKPAGAVKFIKAKKNILEKLFKTKAGPINPVVTVPVEHAPQNPQVYRKISEKKWVPMPGAYANNTLTSTVYHYGFYQVYSPIAGLPFAFGEVYVFPNPSKSGDIPTLHVEVGAADKVTVRIYDISGDLVYQGRVDENQLLVNGKPSYEHAMNSSKFKSGVYNGVVTAEKAGKDIIRKKFRFSVVK